MISVDGYKAFRGTMKIKATIPNGAGGFDKKSFGIYGDWLYKPETKCWYNKTSSYPETICEIAKDETDFGD